MDLYAIQKEIADLFGVLSRLTPDELDTRFKLTQNSPTTHKNDSRQALENEILLRCASLEVVEVRLNPLQGGSSPLRVEPPAPTRDLLVTINHDQEMGGQLCFELSQSMGEWLGANRQMAQARTRGVSLSHEQSYAISALAAATGEEPQALLRRYLNDLVVAELNQHMRSPEDILKLHTLGYYPDKISQALAKLGDPQ